MEKRKTEEILNSLEGFQKAAAPDFFYTRLKARMEAGAKESINRPTGYLRPVWALAFLVIVFAANVFVYFKSSNTVDMVLANENEVFQQTIAGDYGLADNNIMYDLNQDR
jgi:hypothetical protein